MKHINDPLPMPRRIDPGIPEPFERVALKALAKHADDRFQSAAAMAEALMGAAQEAGIQIPETITLPQTDGSSSVRSGAVAVFSGQARQHIPDAGFASGDTDVTTGRNWAGRGQTSQNCTSKSKTIFTPPADLTEVRRAECKRCGALFSGRDCHCQYAYALGERDLWLEGIRAHLAYGTGGGRDIAGRPDEYPCPAPGCLSLGGSYLAMGFCFRILR